MDNLEHLMSAYFHQDWWEEYDGSWHAAVQDFARRSPERVPGLKTEISSLLRRGIEDDEAAGLLNLLPDIVDSARAAADAITSPVDDGWTDERRRQFEGSLLEILESANEFERGWRVGRGGSDAQCLRSGPNGSSSSSAEVTRARQ